MNSGSIVLWFAKNARKAERARTVCADYGLISLHRNLFSGPISTNERLEFENKMKNIFNGRNDKYHVVVLCADCFKRHDVSYAITRNRKPYEIV